MKKKPLELIIPALVLILLASILFPLWDFGGFYWYDAYHGIRAWEYLYFNHLASGPLMAIVMLLFATTAVLMLVSLISKDFGKKRAPYLIGIILISIVFAISLIGAIAVAIVGATEYDDWWWDGACYVGNIAPLLVIPLLIIALLKVSGGKKDEDEE